MDSASVALLPFLFPDSDEEDLWNNMFPKPYWQCTGDKEEWPIFKSCAHTISTGFQPWIHLRQVIGKKSKEHFYHPVILLCSWRWWWWINSFWLCTNMVSWVTGRISHACLVGLQLPSLPLTCWHSNEKVMWKWDPDLPFHNPGLGIKEKSLLTAVCNDEEIQYSCAWVGR